MIRTTLCIAILGACATLADARPVTPGERFGGPLLDVRAPHSAGWVLAGFSDTTLAFVRRAPDAARSDVATVTLFAAPEALDREGFLALVQRAAERESPPRRFRSRESHFEPVDERGYACVAHRSVSDDLQAAGLDAGSTPPVLQLHALYCRHPRRAGLGFAVAYSSRGPGIDAGVAEAARRFIDDIGVPLPAAPQPVAP